MTHFLQRTSLIALIAGAVGASSASAQMPRPAYPTRLPAQPPATAPEQPVGQAPLPSAPVAADAPLATAPSATAVQSTTLAPLSPVAPAPQPATGQAGASAAPAPLPTAPAPTAPVTTAPTSAAPAPQAAPAAPTYRTVTARTVTGRVVDVDGPPETYKVRKGDTLATIAKRMGTTVAKLQADNDLGRRAVIRPGQELKGPGSSAKAYVVGQGDTLFSIARRFNVSVDDLAAENNLTQARSLRNGQRVRLPAGYRDRGPITTSTRVQVDGAAEAEVESAPDTPAARTPAPSRATAARPTRAAPVEDEPADESATRATTRRSVTGRVIDVEGPAVTYTVKKGDNLDKIADRLNTTVADLKKDNKLRRNTIQPGQKLKGPRSEAKAYVAVSGDTLALIGRRFGVTAEAVRSLNGLSRNATIRSGQRIRLPERYRDRGALTETVRTPVETDEPTPAPRTPTPRAVPAEPAPALPSRPQPYSGASASTPRPYSPPQPAAPRVETPAPSNGPAVAPTAAPAIADAQISELGRGKFVWPLQGDIVSDFGPKGGGQRNDGVNIGASAGASIRAAAAGDVVYAGDQVPGFGNLVLIKHADGWVTAYGHLARVDVKMQQKVTQGQQIGQAGTTGGVSEPQLHFEVRYAPSPLERARPIDPKLVLPR